MTQNHSDSYRAGGIILDPEGCVCLVPFGERRVLPSAHRKLIEDPYVVARRMLLRDTGLLDIKFLEKLGTYTRPGKDKGHFIHVTLFVFSTQSRESLFDLAWAPLGELLAHAQHPAEKEFLGAHMRAIEKLAKKLKKIS